MAFTIDYESDWALRLRRLLYTQFRDATTWQQWCDDVLGPQAQDLEDALQTLFTLFSIDDCEGVQLDIIGRVVGQPRNSVDDATYRVYLKARILANRSTGTTEDLYAVFNALLGAIGFVSTTSPIRQFAFRAKTAITRTQAMIAIEFLRAAKEAGAGAVFEWQESPTAQMFTYDTGPGYDQGRLAGAKRA